MKFMVTEVDTRYFESLIKVAELGSIARAARAQNLTAAAVGQRIQALEKHFNIALLHRNSHKASPTDACYRLLPKAKSLLQEFRSMNASIEPEGLSGQFHIGSISTVLSGFLPMAIRQLSNIAPKLVLQIKPGVSTSLFTDLSDGKLDAAIINLPPYPLPQRFKIELLRKEPLLLISNQARGKTVREKLQQNPYICYDSHSWGGLKALQFLTDKKIDVKTFCELDSLEAIEKLVQQNVGVSLVPRWSGLDLGKAGLDFDVIETERYTRKVVFVYPKDCQRPRITDIMGDTLRSTASSTETLA